MTRISRLAVITLATLLLAPPLMAERQRSASYFLEKNLPSLKFTNVTLAEALDYIRDVSGANIVVDWRTLEASNVTKESLVNVYLRNVSLRKALTIILDEAGAGTPLTFYWDQNVLTITTQAQADTVMYTVIYNVKDLLISLPNISVSTANSNFLSSGSSSGTTITPGSGGSSASSLNFSSSLSGGDTSGQPLETQDQKGADLVKLVENCVRPEVWKENGGTASIQFWNGNLVVHAPISVLELIGGPLD